MTYRQLKRQQEKAKTVAIIAATIAAITTLLLVRNASYWQGYNEGYNTGNAEGWQSCIEENNLYDRY